MKPLVMDGITYDKAMIEAIREDLIQLRDSALDQANFDWSISLSHALAALDYLKENTDET